MRRIESRRNPLVARFRRAAENDDRTVVLLDGPHLIGEAVSAGLLIEHVLVGTSHRARPEITALLAVLERSGAALSEATPAVMDAASPVRSSSPVVALASRPKHSRERIFEGRDGALVVVTCGVQDPGNVGAIVRVAEAAGARGVLAAGSTADPFGWKALRASMGSALRLPIVMDADEHRAVADVRSHGFRIAATVPREGESLFDAPLEGRLAVLVGSEGLGLDPALVATADIRVTIPMAAPVESLNAAVSTALLLYEAVRQRRY